MENLQDLKLDASGRFSKAFARPGGLLVSARLTQNMVDMTSDFVAFFQCLQKSRSI